MADSDMAALEKTVRKDGEKRVREELAALEPHLDVAHLPYEEVVKRVTTARHSAGTTGKIKPVATPVGPSADSSMTELLSMMMAMQQASERREQVQQERAERQFAAEERRHAEQMKAAKQADGREFQLKRAGELLKGVLFKMPKESPDIPTYFASVDRLFSINSIADDCKVALLTPYLSDAARNLVSTLPSEDVDTYEHFKAALLREFRLTPDKYKYYFDSAGRRPEESFVQFVTRLNTMIKQYLNSREVNNDYETLIELLLADKLKLHMTSNILSRVRNTEGLTWLRPKKLAELADVYEGDSQFFAQSNRKYQGKGGGAAHPTGNSLETANNPAGKGSIKCFNCSNFGHKAAACTVKCQKLAEPANPSKSETSTPRICSYCNKRGHTADYCFSNPNRIKRSNRVIFRPQYDNTENNVST